MLLFISSYTALWPSLEKRTAKALQRWVGISFSHEAEEVSL